MSQINPGCSCGGLLTVLDRAHVAVLVDSRIFSIPVVLRAAYKLTDRFFVLLQHQDQGLTAYIVARTPDADAREGAGRLANELIDQQLREKLEQQFLPLRTLITAQAFAEGNLLAPDREHADYVRDADKLGEPR